MSQSLWILLLCGAGTFLLRWLPLWHARLRGRAAGTPGRVPRWLAGIGPAAVAALFAVSAGGLLAGDVSPRRVAALALALAAIGIAHRVRGGIVLPTLVGALVYGLLACLPPW